MEWNQSLMATGVDIVDEQHKEIIRRVNHLIQVTKSENEVIAPEAEKLIDFLADYVMMHFRSEEDLQIEVDYPDYKAHKLEHDGFIDRFVETRHTYQVGGAIENNIQALIQMSESWLIEHIAGSDVRFATYYRKVK